MAAHSTFPEDFDIVARNASGEKGETSSCNLPSSGGAANPDRPTAAVHMEAHPAHHPQLGRAVGMRHLFSPMWPDPPTQGGCECSAVQS